MSTGRWLCRHCRRQVSVTSGTLFHRSRLPLTTWFRVIWYVTSQKNGVSAIGVQRVLGLGSYRTAWTWLHKLRRAMVRPGRDRLHGEVEVDEIFVGGEESGREGRAAQKKVLVAIAASLLERWLLGTHQGAVRNDYLDYYLDEFTFRFNRRTSRFRGKLFYRLLQQAMQIGPKPYRDIVKPQHLGPG